MTFTGLKRFLGFRETGPRARTLTAGSRSERTNHEAIAPPPSTCVFKFYLQDTRVVGPFLASPAKPLPSELHQFMDETGEDGVILVSFGTVVEGMKDAILQMMANAFSKLPQTIIWKLKLEGTSRETV